jgi:hypothetical protein
MEKMGLLKGGWDVKDSRIRHGKNGLYSIIF